MPAITEDTRRLNTLISLVGWTGSPEENSCGLRHTDSDEREQFQNTYPDKSTALHLMVAMYAGAVFHQQGLDGNDEDARDLPLLALEAVTGLDDDVLTLLGTMIMDSLHIGSKASPLELARTWRDDVIATSWRVRLAERDDRFGQ